ncbi:uncharacterized protein [Atheta coriaria]|uniref:uncharacterized protein n=1 Tax=Dalotia coriaria TaxID=877792 RepID=UPI0031F44927
MVAGRRMPLTRMLNTACWSRSDGGGRCGGFPLSLTLLLTVVTGLASALKNVAVVVPQAASIGDTVTLQCRYDLESEPLYTLKWYKGAHEFYRYIPKELPSTQIFPYQNLDVDLAKSNQNAVVLRNLQPEHSGRYKCEVSTDAPNFYTHIQSGYMHVLSEYYMFRVLLVCKPTMFLFQVNHSFLTQLPGTNTSAYTDPRKKPTMTVIGLEHEIDNSLFLGGKANIRCTADLFNVYKAQGDYIFEQERPKPRPSSVLQNNNESSSVFGSRPACGGMFLLFNVLLVCVITR